MSYYDEGIVNSSDDDIRLGRKIYMAALAHRRGFRYDQLGIDDVEVWEEIFKELGQLARAAVVLEKK